MRRMIAGVLMLSCTATPKASPNTPSNHADEPTSKRADRSLVVGPFTLVVARTWADKPIASAMRVADLDVAPDTELVITYFGESGAGSTDDNLDRWASEFLAPDGTAAIREVGHLEVRGRAVMMLSIRGQYHDGVHPDLPDRGLLGAIVADPTGPYYFRMKGPSHAIDANEHRFRAMLMSIRSGVVDR